MTRREQPRSVLPAVRVRRWVLGRHRLLGGQVAEGLSRIVTDLVGLHATSPLTPYLSLLARIPTFEAEWLDRELYETRTMVRVPAMRNTLFLVPVSLLRTVVAATGPRGVQSSWRFFARRLSREEYAAAAPRIVKALQGRELTIRELKAELDPDFDVSAAVKLLCDEAVAVRAHPSGGARGGQHRYALAADWLPGLDFAGADETEALADLIRAYLRGYGPVSLGDIVWWTGASKRAVGAALGRLDTELAIVDVEAADTEQLILRADLEALQGAGEIAPGGLALLPELDPYTQGYRDRGRYLDAALTPFVVDRKGNITSTIVIDGLIVGVWDVSARPTPELRVHLLRPLDRARRAELTSLAEHTTTFRLGSPAPVIQYGAMIPVAERAGWVRSPLDGASDPQPLPPCGSRQRRTSPAVGDVRWPSLGRSAGR